MKRSTRVHENVPIDLINTAPVIKVIFAVHLRENALFVHKDVRVENRSVLYVRFIIEIFANLRANIWCIYTFSGELLCAKMQREWP